MRSLIVGLGRSGAGLHLPVLRRLRAAHRGLFSRAPIVGYDTAGTVGQSVPPDTMVRVASLEHACTLLDPRATVVHLCTPPTARVPVLAELVQLGFRHVLVEKPLAVSERELAEILRLRHRHQLRLAVVAPWLASELTERLLDLAESTEFGSPCRLSVVQNKPRFLRSLTTQGHPTAFDVELPHALCVALRLAGCATVISASCADMVLDDLRVSRMGGARLRLRHSSGVLSAFQSDLTAPVRERRITVCFERGTVTGHYPVNSDDDHAQLTITTGGRQRRMVFRDDALHAFLLDAYRRFHVLDDSWAEDLELAADVVGLLSAAKELSGISAEPPVVPVSLTRVSRPAS